MCSSILQPTCDMVSCGGNGSIERPTRPTSRLATYRAHCRTTTCVHPPRMCLVPQSSEVTFLRVQRFPLQHAWFCGKFRGYVSWSFSIYPVTSFVYQSSSLSYCSGRKCKSTVPCMISVRILIGRLQHSSTPLVSIMHHFFALHDFKIAVGRIDDVYS